MTPFLLCLDSIFIFVTRIINERVESREESTKLVDDYVL